MITKFKPIVEAYLKAEVRARERKNKNRAIANLLIERHPTLSRYGREIMETAVSEALTMDRCWRKILEENEHLRGSDYAMKEILEQETELDLDYEPGMQQRSKKVREKVADPIT